jgi:hypothetical protein
VCVVFVARKCPTFFFVLPSLLAYLRSHKFTFMSDDEFNTENFAKYKKDKVAAEQVAKKNALEGDSELQAILTETRQVQQDTLQSSRNAVKTLQETIVVADKTRDELEAQGQQLHKIGATAEQADENAQTSYDRARELHKYKGWLPFSVKQWFTGGKKKDADSEYVSKQKQLDREAEKLAKAQAKAQAKRDGHSGADEAVPGTRPTGDQVEEEIDDNLDEMSRGLDHLKGVGLNMQDEIARQNVDIEHIKATTEHTDYVLGSANRKIQDFL